MYAVHLWRVRTGPASMDESHGATGRPRVLHVITPGDHFSPLTGSAVATVVHGLTSATPQGWPRPAVAVASDTYTERYGSADVLEYPHVPMQRRERYVDLSLGRIGLPRPFAKRRYSAALQQQGVWVNSIVVGHNAVQLVPVVDVRRHRAVLYAHNALLRTYSQREAMRTLASASAIVTVSHFLADRIQESLPRPLRKRVTVVHNGVDETLFQPRATPNLGGPMRVLYVGRVIPSKGVATLVEAVLKLSRPDIVLTVVGSAGFDSGLTMTDYERVVRRRVASAGERIHILPFVPRAQVATLMAGADVVVVPSQWPEPFALTVLEGMASGAAVIASNVGGIPEAAGGAALLVPPSDPQALAEALEAFADDRTLMETYKAMGLNRARRQTWAVASQEFHSVLSRID